MLVIAKFETEERELINFSDGERESFVIFLVFCFFLGGGRSLFFSILSLFFFYSCKISVDVVKRKREREKMEKTKRIEERKYAGDNTLTEYTVEEGVEEIGWRAFNWCENLKKVTLSRGVRYIGKEAFAWTGLTEVILKEGVENIGGGAFKGCSLERVVLVKGIKRFGAYAFANNQELTELDIHEGVEEIGEAFVWGTSLQTITLPLHPIPRFHEQAFQGSGGPPLPSLRTLRLRGTYHATLSIPFPRITEWDGGQLVRFIKDQQTKHLREELLLADTIFYVCFSLKCESAGLYNAYGSPVLARIFRFWFRGASLPFPIRREKKIRSSTKLSDDKNDVGRCLLM